MEISQIANFKLLFFIHIVISVIISIIVFILLSRKIEKNLKYFFPIFLISFLLPIIGYLLSPLYFLFLFRLRDESVIDCNRIYTKNIVMGKIKVNQRKLGEGALNVLIKEKKGLNEKVVFAVRNMQNPFSVKAAKVAITEADTPEARLYAFSIISSIEKGIEGRINDLKLLLKEKDIHDEKRAEILFNIASLYWDLVYLNVIDTELENFTINESLTYLDKAMKASKKPEHSLLAGKIYLHMYNKNNKERKTIKKSEKFLLEAFKYGDTVVRTKTAPYLAEVAFIYKNFKEIKKLFEMVEMPLHPETYFIKLFWTEKNENIG